MLLTHRELLEAAWEDIFRMEMEEQADTIISSHPDPGNR